MKKLPILMLLLFLYSFYAYSQDEKLKKIKALYAETNDKIAKSKLPSQDGWGNLYSTEVNVNSNNGSWRAVGTYSNKIIFWYNDQPGFQQEENQPDWFVLEKIEINSLIAIGTFHEEYLYEKGQLVFYYKTIQYGDLTKQEYRFYFSNGKLFRYQENQDLIKDLKTVESADILKRSEKLQQLFLQTFN